MQRWSVSAHRYCEACGDCLVCYEEDRCYDTDDGRHVEPRGHREDGEATGIIPEGEDTKIALE